MSEFKMVPGSKVPSLIEKDMQDSYLRYSMSVIVSRALPDVRDGLKPVHRRVLFGMHELGLTTAKSTRKSATIVGEVMGKGMISHSPCQRKPLREETHIQR